MLPSEEVKECAECGEKLTDGNICEHSIDVIDPLCQACCDELQEE